MFMSDWLVCMKCNPLTIKRCIKYDEGKAENRRLYSKSFKSNSHPFKMKKIESSIVC